MSTLEPDLDLEVVTEEFEVAAEPGRTARRRSSRATGQKWMRLVHVYTSMICLLIVLFFSVTGLTLNHPNWTLGGSGESVTRSGTFPQNIALTGNVQWLEIAEYLRSTYDLRGAVAEHDSAPTQGSITFKAPGFAADTLFDPAARTYEITIDSQGPIGVMNDLHKGRDSSKSWKWVIDASAILLILISATGLGLQLYLRARRRSALFTATGGAVLFVGLVWLALR